jgi:hypothetical protein
MRKNHKELIGLNFMGSISDSSKEVLNGNG